MATSIIRISQYTPRSKGVIRIESDTVENLMIEVDKLFKEYPKRPYDSSITGIVKTANGMYMCLFEHWGAD